MSRFAADPKWLIYLPPTMAPCDTGEVSGMLEHPSRAFAYYRSEGVPTVMCQEKHMGSRCVLIVCRNREAARRRFGIIEDDFIARGRHSLAQPAVKCRGPEYLRIIYGPEFTLPENLDRLRSRGLSVKRSLALREFALGVEALERFVRSEPLRRVHECIFAVLVLESEPVDPRP